MIERSRLKLIALAGLAAMSLGSFALSAPAMAQEKKLKVVATFSILGDLAKQVGGDKVEVISLVGPNGDAHVFSPSTDDAKNLAAADVVVTNGLGLEGWLDRLVKASGTKAVRVVASKGVTPQKGEEEGHVGIDPHAWQSIANAKIYVANIRDAFDAADAKDKAAFDANAAAYLAKLTTLEGEVKAAIATIPQARRKIITSHDAFGYFGKAYGMEFIAPQGVSTETEASAKDVGKIVKQIKAQKIPAVFLENISDPRLAERIAKESGAKIGGQLFSDALSPPDGPAGTYIDMFRSNIKALTAALVS